MNIVITLPEKLVSLILCGDKIVEVRKTAPTNFDVFSDYVFVVQKGTDNVVAALEICAFFVYEHWKSLAKDYRDCIGVPDEWLRDYFKGGGYRYAWRIMRAFKFAEPFSARRNLGIKANPQAYVYTNTSFIEMCAMYGGHRVV